MHDHWCETEGQFVDEQKSGLGGEGPGEHEHLLLTPRQESGLAVEEPFEFREEFEGAVHAARSEVEVDAGRQLSEHGSFFGDEAESASDTSMERSGEGSILEVDVPSRGEHPGDGEHGGGLAGTVGPEQRDEFAGRDLQVDAVHDGDVAVTGGEALDVEHQAGVPR